MPNFKAGRQVLAPPCAHANVGAQGHAIKMASHFKTVGLVGRYPDARVAATIEKLTDYLLLRGLHVLLDRSSADRAPSTRLEILDRGELGERADLAIVVGGDGTLLNAARGLAAHDVPLLGVNLGRLGFLTDVSTDDMVPVLDAILDGRYLEESRFLLEATIHREGELISRSDAFNDVVVHKWSVARMIEFETRINGNFINIQRADGIIVSSPTGSTAYALSAGGAIVQPSLNALILAPICPHTLSHRPIVVDGDSDVEIVVGETTHEAQVTCDGQISLALMGGDCIRVGKKSYPVRLIHPAGHDHFAMLRAKLSWGKQT